MRSNYYPWYCKSTEMRINLLVMCKLLFLLLLLHGFWGKITDPYIPFVQFLDVFREYPGLFESIIKSLFLASGLALLFNIRVRTMAILLGLTIFIFLLASKPQFRNHIFICGCAFFLSGLTHKDQAPKLLYYQLSLVYIGAVINKVFQIDWWDGQFMHNWLLYARENELYEYVYGILGNLSLSKFLSWSSMAIELSIGIMILFKKSHAAAVWTILIFHSILFATTGTRFGHFVEDILIYLLVFNAWPEENISINIDMTKTKITRYILPLINWNKQYRIRELNLEKSNWIQVSFSDKNLFNYNAISAIILYSPATYFLLLFLDYGVQIIFGRITEHIITLIWLGGGILFFFFHKVWPGSYNRRILSSIN